MKIKIKYFGDRLLWQQKKGKIIKIDSRYICLPEIVPDSVYKMKNDDDDEDDDDDDDKYYWQIDLEQHRYEEMKKKEKKTRYIKEEIVIPNNHDKSHESDDW